MKKPLLSTLLLMTGFSLGWLCKAWIDPEGNHANTALTAADTDAPKNTRINDQDLASSAAQEKGLSLDTALSNFIQWLKERRYPKAMQIYRAKAQFGISEVAAYKEALLDHLNMLMESGHQNDFSELTNLFLSSFYDDIDVLLLLAEFNHNNNAHMEAINIYQLASTYAYTQSEQQKIQNSFHQFVDSTDHFYTEEQDWLALSNFYTHIETVGLITSRQQYRQAIAQLLSGHREIAITQLERLQNDALIGEQARRTLEELKTNPNSEPSHSWQSAQAINLEKKDAHYLIKLSINQSDNVTLLIDTGASVTTLSSNAFYTLNSQTQAIEAGNRIFQTANGPTQGTVYIIPQITIGPYQVNNTQVAVLDFTMPDGVDGLLGMNILGQYRFQIDQENVQLLLEKK